MASIEDDYSSSRWEGRRGRGGEGRVAVEEPVPRL